MKVKNWMTPSPVAVSPGTPVAKAQESMLSRRIRHLPVTEGERLVGIVTDRDIRTALPSPATSFSVGEIRFLWDKLTVGQVMTSSVVTVSPDQPLLEAVRLMVDRKIGALPVTQYGRLVGIITETDLMRALATTIAPVAETHAATNGTVHDTSAIQTVLVPLDGTAGSETVLATIGELATAEGAKVRLLHVATPVHEVRDEDRIIAYVDQETARVEQEWLVYLRKAAAALHGIDVDFAVRFGEPVIEIADEAKISGASLIAMATHRRSGISRIVKGSVAEQVARGTAIPVMLVQYGEASAA